MPALLASEAPSLGPGQVRPERPRIFYQIYPTRTRVRPRISIRFIRRGAREAGDFYQIYLTRARVRPEAPLRQWGSSSLRSGSARAPMGLRWGSARAERGRPSPYSICPSDSTTVRLPIGCVYSGVLGGVLPRRPIEGHSSTVVPSPDAVVLQYYYVMLLLLLLRVARVPKVGSPQLKEKNIFFFGLWGEPG